MLQRVHFPLQEEIWEDKRQDRRCLDREKEGEKKMGRDSNLERWRYPGPTGPQLPDVQSLQSPKFPHFPLGARNLTLSKFAKRKNEKSKNRPKPVGMPVPRPRPERRTRRRRGPRRVMYAAAARSPKQAGARPVC